MNANERKWGESLTQRNTRLDKMGHRGMISFLSVSHLVSSVSFCVKRSHLRSFAANSFRWHKVVAGFFAVGEGLEEADGAAREQGGAEAIERVVEVGERREDRLPVGQADIAPHLGGARGDAGRALEAT